MGSVLLSRHRLRVNNISYFRSHADEIRLGSIGRKRWSLIRNNYLDVKDTIPAGRIPSRFIQTGELDISDQRSVDFNLGTTIEAIIEGVPVQVNGNIATEMFRKSELSLLKFSVDNNPMRDVINQSSKERQELFILGHFRTRCTSSLCGH